MLFKGKKMCSPTCCQFPQGVREEGAVAEPLGILSSLKNMTTLSVRRKAVCGEAVWERGG